MDEQPPQQISFERDSATIIINNADSTSGSTSGNNINAAASDDGRPGVSGVHLLLMCLDTERHVRFHEGVVDNEGMDRRKSKCCCIYRKPHIFGESSSSSDDECEHCCGHPEVRLRNRLKKQQQQQQQQKQQQQTKLCQCKCHCHHGNQSQHNQPHPATTQDDTTIKDTEVAGDAGNVKAQTGQPIKSLALVSKSSQAVQH